MTMIEKVARAICAHNTNGFCDLVGCYAGCKVGVGEMPDGANCAASTSQLRQSREYDMARAAIEALREPSEGMISEKDGYTDLAMMYCGDDPKQERRDEFKLAWRCGIDHILDEDTP